MQFADDGRCVERSEMRNAAERTGAHKKNFISLRSSRSVGNSSLFFNVRTLHIALCGDAGDRNGFHSFLSLLLLLLLYE